MVCDKEIGIFLRRELKKCPEKKKLKTTDKPYKKVNKNALQVNNLNQVAIHYFGGIDLMAIEGVSHATILSIMSEIGLDGFKKLKRLDQKRKMGIAKRIKKSIAKFDLKPEDVGFCNSLNMNCDF